MKTARMLSAAILSAGHLLIADSLAAPLTAPAMAPPELHGSGPQILRIQADRMMRLRQHRAILEDAFRPHRDARPAEPLRPQTRVLQAPAELRAQVSCEAAADIVADFGFSDIRPSDCSGDLYRFSAMRDGTAYSIGVTAGAGEIAEVSRQ